MTSETINELVAFTLRKHSVSAKFAIISLNQKEWRKLSEERVVIDEFAYKMRKEIQKMLNNGVPLDSDTAQKLRESMNMERLITAEYNRSLRFEEHVNSTSIIFNIKILRVSEVFKEKHPFMYKLYLKNVNKDFLILLNTYLLSSLGREEIFLSVAHEALHFVNTCLGNRLTYKEVEDNARVIVREFLSSR